MNNFNGIWSAPETFIRHGGIGVVPELSNQKVFDLSEIQSIRQNNKSAQSILLPVLKVFFLILTLVIIAAVSFSREDLDMVMNSIFAGLSFGGLCLVVLAGSKKSKHIFLTYNQLCDETLRQEIVIGDEGIKISLAVINSRWMNHLDHCYELAKAGFPYLFIPWKELELKEYADSNPDFVHYILCIYDCEAGQPSRLGEVHLDSMRGSLWSGVSDIMKDAGVISEIKSRVSNR